ncbi:unnamed protein product [Gongylonema pulchrum]|uniref:PCI domain-containing protein n=1 Tax=Gongylonema pulchrum TaxID=637853 RepID=A0A183DS72_9BILA|nr:unnamed protein product [Gongylonema pulchrum]
MGTNAALPDLLGDALQQRLGKTVTRPAVSKDMGGVHRLIADGHFRAAVNLTAHLLTQANQGFGMAGQPSSNTQYTFEVWACRFQLLMALKLYVLLNEELASFEELDAPDLYYQYYPNLFSQKQKGSLVLFSMRLIHAEALCFTPFPWAALERIDRLEQNVNKVLANSAGRSERFQKIWNDRLLAVQKMRARTLFFLKEYTTSMVLYNRLSRADMNREQKVALKLMLMRMALAVGDEKKLERYSNEVATMSSDNDVLHRCLKRIFYGDYSEAVEVLYTRPDFSATSEVNNFRN